MRPRFIAALHCFRQCGSRSRRAAIYGGRRFRHQHRKPNCKINLQSKAKNAVPRLPLGGAVIMGPQTQPNEVVVFGRGGARSRGSNSTIRCGIADDTQSVTTRLRGGTLRPRARARPPCAKGAVSLLTGGLYETGNGQPLRPFGPPPLAQGRLFRLRAGTRDGRCSPSLRNYSVK